MKALFLVTALLLNVLSFAEAREVKVPVQVKIDGLYMAGMIDYLDESYVLGELHKQTDAACGKNAFLTKLDIHYVVERSGGDTMNAQLQGTVHCQTWGPSR
jgi:hypothetical protein